MYAYDCTHQVRHNSFDCSVLGSKIVGPLYECTNVPGLFLSMEAYSQQLVPKNKKAAPFIFKEHLLPVEASKKYSHKVCAHRAMRSATKQPLPVHRWDTAIMLKWFFQLSWQFDKFGSVMRSTVTA
eukprot:scaffold2542_cov325-Prasinococcus_capsulatus_cf.AAC.6